MSERDLRYDSSFSWQPAIKQLPARQCREQGSYNFEPYTYGLRLAFIEQRLFHLQLHVIFAISLRWNMMDMQAGGGDEEPLKII
jgi:hypothetical protein